MERIANKGITVKEIAEMGLAVALGVALSYVSKAPAAHAHGWNSRPGHHSRLLHRSQAGLARRTASPVLRSA